MSNHTKLMKRMKKELREYDNFTLEHMLKVYDRVVEMKKLALKHAIISLSQCKRERTAIRREIADRAEKNAN